MESGKWTCENLGLGVTSIGRIPGPVLKGLKKRASHPADRDGVGYLDVFDCCRPCQNFHSTQDTDSPQELEIMAITTAASTA